MNDEEQRLEAIRINLAIGKYSKSYCPVCGNEIDVYEDQITMATYFNEENICEYCKDNN